MAHARRSTMVSSTWPHDRVLRCQRAASLDGDRGRGGRSAPGLPERAADFRAAGHTLGSGQDTGLCDASPLCALPLVAKNRSEYPSGSTTTSSCPFPAVSRDVRIPLLSRCAAYALISPTEMQILSPELPRADSPLSSLMRNQLLRTSRVGPSPGISWNPSVL